MKKFHFPCIIVAAIFLISSLGSCVFPYKKKNRLDNYLKVGDTLKIQPSGLLPVFSNTQDLSVLLSSPLKIIGYADAGCSMCTYNLSLWKEFMEGKAAQWNIPVVLIVGGASLPSVQFRAETLIPTGNLYYDKNSVFILGNSIHPSPNYQAFLVGIDNKIQLIGNVGLDSTWYPKYDKKIKKVLAR